jgi:hypothetical protein
VARNVLACVEWPAVAGLLAVAWLATPTQRVALAQLDVNAGETALATRGEARPSPADPPALRLPLRAAFYYPWYDPSETWPRSHWPDSQPDLRRLLWWPDLAGTHAVDCYDSRDPGVIERHLEAMRWANIDVGIVSWSAGGPEEDMKIARLLELGDAVGFHWCVYYEHEGYADPPPEELVRDLLRIYTQFAQDDAYLKLDGRFVVFVYTKNDCFFEYENGQCTPPGLSGPLVCDVVERWYAAAVAFARLTGISPYINLKVFGNYRDCEDAQFFSWHQYSTGNKGWDAQSNYSFTIRPGFWRWWSENPSQERIWRVWKGNLISLVYSSAQWQLVSTFNEWLEGTSVEDSLDWESPSGYGRFLDDLHAYPTRRPRGER